MGKLNVTMLRYLTKDDFRVLTAVSAKEAQCFGLHNLNVVWKRLCLPIFNGPLYLIRSKWE